MRRFFRAEEIFRDFPDDVRLKIFKAAEGKLVYFPKSKDGSQKIESAKVILDYAVKGKSYDKIAEEINTNKMRICRIVNYERKQFSKERIEYWKSRGLSLRDIARLYKRSHEAVRQGLSKDNF